MGESMTKLGSCNGTAERPLLSETSKGFSQRHIRCTELHARQQLLGASSTNNGINTPKIWYVQNAEEPTRPRKCYEPIIRPRWHLYQLTADLANLTARTKPRVSASQRRSKSWCVCCHVLSRSPRWHRPVVLIQCMRARAWPDTRVFMLRPHHHHHHNHHHHHRQNHQKSFDSSVTFLAFPLVEHQRLAMADRGATSAAERRRERRPRAV